ncbi:unnamed protein product [Spodoptera littoralis]|uniref:Cyclic nucleotide-binding domain-containing protein n=1 Tax=Spodoptera littoralis TaxID=7109 RepID=A0A9P0N0L9_SPOLI|nr:unnamed protein product [Spodoptera littoralis]CAH1635525.1 unnamed protein product [Spodoptera littoralis]
MPHKKHNCDLNLGSDSMLPKKTTLLGRMCRSLRKLGQLTKHHPETYEYFRSYSAVVAERQRQLLEEGGNLFTESYIVHGLVRLNVMFVLSSHWCSCLMYCPAIVVYYWTGEMPTHYNFYMRIPGTKDLMGHDLTTRYNKAIIIALSAFFGTGFTMFRSTEPDEILIHSVIIVYAAMFMVFTLVYLIKSYLTIYGSTMRYQGLMNQVEVCHLEDGHHFGEVALLMKDSKRIATVVAVEITQLYRLDAVDFNRFVLSHPTLYDRIEELASRRMHQTVLLDDEFRREREQHNLAEQLFNLPNENTENLNKVL